MLTRDEINYLNKIPTHQMVAFHSYDPETPNIVAGFINKIKSVGQALEVIHLGSSSLGISGQGDIDLSILIPKDKFSGYTAKLKKVLGEPVSGISIILWKFNKQGHDIEICLADPKDPSTDRQLKVQEILKNNPDLLKEYAELKEKMSQKTYREYQQKKYEFYNRILN